MTTQALDIFQEHRELLFGIAYRMLGTVMDAQDMVQDTFLRWQRTSLDEVKSPRAWLTTVITRLCINHLKSARVQRETYIGTWLPEPLVERESAENAQLADSLSLAFLVLLETLTPTERAVFILREVLNCEFSEIATIVKRSEVNCRQVLARARKHIEERRPRFDASPEQAEELMLRFQRAVINGEIENLLSTLASDVVLVSDGGGKAPALLAPIQGAETLARVVINGTRRFRSKTEELLQATVNGLPGLVSFEGERAVRVMAFGISGERIRMLFVITNPDKLRHLTRPLPSALQLT
jgi:RNA polymerase sigma-70 factor (ECF subfamily)